jgi:peroxiredoxin
MYMKNPLSVFLLLLVVFAWPSVPLSAQANKQLPLFSMTLSSGRYFNMAEIPKGRPVLLFYFDPECDHCHTLMNEFFKRTADFKSAEIMLVTFKPLTDVQAFAQAYQTHQYPNIKVGTEGTTYYLRNFYRLQNLPFAALYSKAGQLIAGYQKKVPLEMLQKELKKIERPL